MSAAEKLERLAVSHAIDWPAPSYGAYRLAEDAERLRKNAIDRALPELIAVVRALEEVDVRAMSDYDADLTQRTLSALAAKLETE